MMDLADLPQEQMAPMDPSNSAKLLLLMVYNMGIVLMVLLPALIGGIFGKP